MSTEIYEDVSSSSILRIIPLKCLGLGKSWRIKKTIKSKEILGGKTGFLLPCSEWYIEIKWIRQITFSYWNGTTKRYVFSKDMTG